MGQGTMLRDFHQMTPFIFTKSKGQVLDDSPFQDEETEMEFRFYWLECILETLTKACGICSTEVNTKKGILASGPER